MLHFKRSATLLLTLTALLSTQLAVANDPEWNGMISELAKDRDVILTGTATPARTAPQSVANNVVEFPPAVRKIQRAHPTSQDAIPEQSIEEILARVKPRARATSKANGPSKKSQHQNSKGLLRAVKAGDYNSAKNLILSTANVNYARNNGETLLHIAAANGDLNMTRMLAANGADIHARTIKDWTPSDLVSLTEGTG